MLQRGESTLCWPASCQVGVGELLCSSALGQAQVRAGHQLSVEDLEAEEAEGGGLRKHIFKMLPFLGVNRHIKSGWRHLHSMFGGIGLH